jgi:hypothetical protein
MAFNFLGEGLCSGNQLLFFFPLDFSKKKKSDILGKGVCSRA